MVSLSLRTKRSIIGSRLAIDPASSGVLHLRAQAKQVHHALHF